MTRSANISLTWADGEHEFRLPIGKLRELQELCDAGPPVVAQRLASGTWKVEDIRETLRLGLIGGGMAPGAALSRIQRYVDERPLLENVKAAQAVILAALVGVDEEPVGEEAAAKANEKGLQTESSLSPQSTGPAPSSDTPPETSTL